MTEIHQNSDEHKRRTANHVRDTEALAALVNQEEAILAITELICKIMRIKKVNASQLAQKMGKTKGYISQLLDGEANMTIRTLADVLRALDCKLQVEAMDSDGRLYFDAAPQLTDSVWCSEDYMDKWLEHGSFGSLASLAG